MLSPAWLRPRAGRWCPGGGNVKHLKELPAGCRAGDNANAFLGAFDFGRIPENRGVRMPAKNNREFSEPEIRRTELATTIQSVITHPLTERPAWKELQTHFKEIGQDNLRTLFAPDPERGSRMTAEAAGIYLDYSKNRITDETLKLLVQLADESGLRSRIEAMFRGEKINRTENRAVLHVALRAPRETSI